MASSKTQNKGHADRAHAILGASSSSIWLNCPGAPQLWEQIPKKPAGVYAEEGTAAHELCEALILKTDEPESYLGKKFNNFKVDEDMIKHCTLFRDYVLEQAEKRFDPEISVEEKFDLGWIYPGMFGTNDACIREDGGLLEVIDFKYGAGIPVEVEENSQLIYYALGAFKGGHYTRIKLTIVQPRCEHPDGPIRSWECTPEYLMEWAKKLKKGALATKKKNAPLNPGEHCRFCNAAGCCPQIAKNAVEAAKADFIEEVKPTLPEVKTLSDKQLVTIIENRKMIETFLTKVSEHAQQRLENGEQIKGLKLVNKRGRRVWKVDDDELGRIFGDDIYIKKTLSVAQAEKSFGKSDLDGMWETYIPGVTIAPENDRRKAIEQRANAKDDFDKIETDEITEDMF